MFFDFGLKFLKVLRFDSCKASVLLSASKSSLMLLMLWMAFYPPLNALGRLLFIGVWGWVSDTWQSLIGDTCHSLIGPLMSSLTCTGLHMSSLTRAGLLMLSLTCVDV